MKTAFDVIAHDLRVINDNLSTAIETNSTTMVIMAKVKLEKLMSAIEKMNAKKEALNILTQTVVHGALPTEEEAEKIVEAAKELRDSIRLVNIYKQEIECMARMSKEEKA